MIREDSNHLDVTSKGIQNDQSLADLLESVNRAVERGEEIDLVAVQRKHPKYADRLQELLPTLTALATWGQHNEIRDKPNSSDSQSALRDQILGDFRIIRELGRGGMGTVYEAKQDSMGRRVALKVLPFAALADGRALKRFRNEVRAVASLDHPHIVSVYSVGEEKGIHYYAMQLIHGQTFAKLISQTRCELLSAHGSSPEDIARESTGNEHPTIDSSQTTIQDEQALLSTVVNSRRDAERYRTAARMTIQAAEALQHAHEQGVIHRDIKPGNLMLDVDGKVYVTDFGLARIEADAGMTMTGDILGTLRYMAPEQALAKRVVIDHRADIYSLGATLYELLTLRPAFGDTDRNGLLNRIAFDEPTPLRKLDRHVPAELETIVLKAMAKSPDGRYQTAQELADDLQALLDNRPIAAKRPSLVDLAAKWSKRHVVAVWATALAASAIAATMVAATLVSMRQTDRALVAEERAKSALEIAEDRLAIARSAIDDMYTEVAEDWLDEEAELRPKQRSFLKKAAASYKLLAAQESDNLDVRLASFAAMSRAAVIYWELDEMTEGELAYRKLLTEFDAMVAEFGNVPETREQLADAIKHQAHAIHWRGRPAKAVDLYLRSIDIYKTLLETSPESSKKQIASNWQNLGLAYQSLQRPKDALEAFEKAHVFFSELHEEFPANEYYASWNAGTLTDIASALKRLDRDDEAARVYSESAQLFEDLVERDPQSLYYRGGLARALINRAGGANDDQKAAELFVAMIEEDPSEAGHLYGLTLARYNQSVRQFNNGEIKNARRTARAALPYARRLVGMAPDKFVYQGPYLQTLMSSAGPDNIDGIHEEFQKWAQGVDLKPDTPFGLRNAYLSGLRQLARFSVAQGEMSEAADYIREVRRLSLASRTQNTREIKREYGLLQVNLMTGDVSDTLDCLRLAPLLIRLGKFDEYDHLRKESIERWADSKDPYIGDHLVRICLLHEPNEEILTQLSPVRGVLLKGLKEWDAVGETGQSELMVNLALALLSYRHSEWDASRMWCEKAIQAHDPEDDGYLRCVGHLILAMAQFQQGDRGAATQNLAMGTDLIETFDTEEEQWGGEGFHWYFWEHPAILSEEAAGLILSTER